MGSLLYVSTTTRPDISAAVNILRRCETTREKDWNAVKGMISYLNCTKDCNLTINTEHEPRLSDSLKQIGPPVQENPPVVTYSCWELIPYNGKLKNKIAFLFHLLKQNVFQMLAQGRELPG